MALLKQPTFNWKTALLFPLASIPMILFALEPEVENPVKLLLIPYNETPEPKHSKNSIHLTDKERKKYVIDFSGEIFMDCEHYNRPLKILAEKVYPYESNKGD